MEINEVVEIFPYIVLACAVASGCIIYWAEHRASELFNKEPNHEGYQAEMSETHRI